MSVIRVNNQKTIIEKAKILFWNANFGWYIKRKKKTLHWFFQKFQFLQCYFFPSCCKLAMAWHGKILRMNFSCPDSEFWLDDWKVLGFCGVLYSETFKALWRGREGFKNLKKSAMSFMDGPLVLAIKLTTDIFVFYFQCKNQCIICFIFRYWKLVYIVWDSILYKCRTAIILITDFNFNL